MKINVLSLAVVYVSMLCLSVATLVYATKVNEESDRKFCNLLDTVVTAYHENPEPTTELGLRLRDEYFNLQRDLGC